MRPSSKGEQGEVPPEQLHAITPEVCHVHVQAGLMGNYPSFEGGSRKHCFKLCAPHPRWVGGGGGGSKTRVSMLYCDGVANTEA